MLFGSSPIGCSCRHQNSGNDPDVVSGRSKDNKNDAGKDVKATKFFGADKDGILAFIILDERRKTNKKVG